MSGSSFDQGTRWGGWWTPQKTRRVHPSPASGESVAVGVALGSGVTCTRGGGSHGAIDGRRDGGHPLPQRPVRGPRITARRSGPPGPATASPWRMKPPGQTIAPAPHAPPRLEALGPGGTRGRVALQPRGSPAPAPDPVQVVGGGWGWSRVARGSASRWGRGGGGGCSTAEQWDVPQTWGHRRTTGLRWVIANETDSTGHHVSVPPPFERRTQGGRWPQDPSLPIRRAHFPQRSRTPCGTAMRTLGTSPVPSARPGPCDGVGSRHPTGRRRKYDQRRRMRPSGRYPTHYQRVPRRPGGGPSRGMANAGRCDVGGRAVLERG